MNHYKTLGVHKLSTPAELKAAYVALAGENHPDRFPGDAAKANRMAEVNVAYGVLKDDKKRRDYDKQLALLGKKCGACAGGAVTWKQKGFTKRVAVPCLECGGSGYL